MSGQPRNALVKQLVYGLIGFCALTGIVFAVIYPEGKLSFWGAVFISMTVVAAFGSPVLLVVALVLSSSRKHKAQVQKPEAVISTESSSSRKLKYWDGTLGDAFQWFCWGVCLPVAGLIGGLNNPEKVHPAVGMIVAAGIGLVIISIRVRTGKWPEGGNSSE